jgi:protoheme IX farnesyltransferase
MITKESSSETIDFAPLESEATRLIHFSKLRSLSSDWLSLIKPRLSLLVLFTCGCGIVMHPEFSNFTLLWETIFATSGVVAGACALNCYLERHLDKLMQRTHMRPLPQGRIRPYSALFFGILLLSFSLMCLWLIQPLTFFLGVIAAIFYLFLYTPMKLRSPFALYIGAIPGALPPLMGWSSVAGEVALTGWWLFLLLFLWQLPHFLAISLSYRRDYNLAGFKIFPNTHGARSTYARMVLFTLFFVLVSLAPGGVLDLTPGFYLGMGLLQGAQLGLVLCGGLLLSSNIHFLKWSRLFFWFTLVYFPLYFGILFSAKS